MGKRMGKPRRPSWRARATRARQMCRSELRFTPGDAVLGARLWRVVDRHHFWDSPPGFSADDHRHVRHHVPVREDFGMTRPEGEADLRAELRLVGDVAEFVVATEQPVYQDRIVHMGWVSAGNGLFVRRLAAVADVDRIFDNFARHLEEMVLQSARLRPVPWQHALEEFLVRVDGSDLNWWLYGSGALAVRGIDVDPGDLDFVVDDAELAGSIFSDLLVEPVTRLDGWVAEWGGRAFDGALFEWIADAHPSGAAQPHEQEPAAAAHLETIRWRGYPVRVPVLAFQLAVAMERGRHDRAALIRAAMAH